MRYLVFAVLFFFSTLPVMALELALPVACEVGKTCWVQQYADHDGGAGATDYACGVASYNGHDGTDIRVLHTAVLTDVVAAASGTVRAVRDGVEDRLVSGPADLARVKGRECGNGVVVSHGEGWETQYCHLRKGSVAVKAGDAVVTGARLGQIGFSGEAAFPHVHLTVRQNGKPVDPFSADSMADCKASDRSMWSSAAQQALAYEGTTVLDFRWGERVYEAAEMDAGTLPDGTPAQDWDAVVAHVWLINAYAGDEISLLVRIPGAEPIVNRVTLERNRAQQRLHSGKKKRGNWPAGEYVAEVTVRRDGVEVLQKTISVQMN